MILVQRPEDRDRLRKCLKALPATGGLCLLIVIELLGYDSAGLRIAYVPAVIASAWFAGGPFTLIALACASALKWHFAGSSGTASSLSPIFLNETSLWFAECAAITILTSLLRRSREQANHLAGRDPLTGLANRAAFMKRLEAEINRGRRSKQPFTLVYLDCDHFKEINDTLGHAAGDALLREVAHSLESGIRNYDLAARLGGDEFALLLPMTGPESAKAVVERLCRQLQSSMATRPWPVTLSTGVATFQEPDLSGDKLIEVTDQAMYRAKQTMRGSTDFVVH